MPLRSKIKDPAFAAKAKLSTLPRVALPRTLKNLDEPEDVLFNSIYGLRTIELNRPAKLNALNASMINKILPRMQEWTKSDMANVIVMKGAGPKAFCAGGDVATLAHWNATSPRGQALSTAYFALEYQLDHLIATYKKPYIAIMDGITMGGGVGLSVHAPIRIATERTVFAMPETTIGFFPDVGASFFLPRLPGAVGTYLALTSERLTGVNVFYAGLATHYIHSTTLPMLEARLSELRFKDYHTLLERLTLIDATIEEFSSGLPHDQPILLGGQLRQAIDHCFSQKTIHEILQEVERVENEAEGELLKWARKTLETLHGRSPTSVVTTLKQMQLGKTWSIRQTFHREYHMAAKFMAHPDFVEGVSALLISKPKRSPQWQPADLESLNAGADAIVADVMLGIDDQLPLFELHDRPSDSGNYIDYPFREFGLPTEAEVEDAWKNKMEEGMERYTKIIEDRWLSRYDRREQIRRPSKLEKKKEAVLAYFAEKRKGKQGVREVVEEIIHRRVGDWEED